ncbi:AlpA family phage regulatory protein [Vibrio sinaloensis]|nr:AlpA family phage regulatory protein [Vibrio sinaloensis]
MFTSPIKSIWEKQYAKTTTHYIQTKILRLKDIALLTGLSRSTIYDKQNPKSPRFDSTFPLKIQLGARAVGWREKGHHRVDQLYEMWAYSGHQIASNCSSNRMRRTS